MNRLLGIILVLLLLKNGAIAHTPYIMPSDTPLIGFKGKPKFFFTFDNTSSFVGGRAASTNEVKLGLDFRKKLRLGLGYGLLVSDVVAEKQIRAVATGNDSVVNAQLELNFFSANAEYVFYESKRWQITAPLGVGMGASFFKYYDSNLKGGFEEKRLDEGTILVTSLSGMATYRILRWVGLSGGLGVRLALVNNDKIKESLNSPVGVFKFRIFLGEIYKSVFPKGINGKRNPPYSNEYWD